MTIGTKRYMLNQPIEGVGIRWPIRKAIGQWAGDRFLIPVAPKRFLCSNPFANGAGAMTLPWGGQSGAQARAAFSPAAASTSSSRAMLVTAMSDLHPIHHGASW